MFFVGGEKKNLFSNGICRIIQNGPAEFASNHNCGSHLDHISRKDDWATFTSRQRLQKNVLLHHKLWRLCFTPTMPDARCTESDRIRTTNGPCQSFVVAVPRPRL